MIVYRNFDGDVRQATAGLAAHGVTFKEATTVFAAEDLTVTEDPASGILRAIGTSARGRKLVVLHQRGQRIRILGVELEGQSGTMTFESPPVVAPEPAPAEPEPAPAIALAPPPVEACESKPIVETTTAPIAPRRSRTRSAAPSPSPSPSRTSPPPSPPPPPPVEAETPRSAPATTGWTAEAYEIYWAAYTAAREDARRRGKTPREAQRLGREAGERAAEKPILPPPKEASRSSSWRSAARTVKLDG